MRTYRNNRQNNSSLPNLFYPAYAVAHETIQTLPFSPFTHLQERALQYNQQRDKREDQKKKKEYVRCYSNKENSKCSNSFSRT